MTITGNAVLYGDRTDTYSVFYGQDYSQRDEDSAAGVPDQHSYIVNDLSDVQSVDLNYTLNDFENSHSRMFAERDSAVTVLQLINVVATVNAQLTDYRRQSATGASGQRRIRHFPLSGFRQISQPVAGRGRGRGTRNPRVMRRRN